jgi:hypothetical protein
MKLPLAPLAVFNLVRELRGSAAKHAPLVLGGAPLLVDALRRELVRDGDASAVRDASLGALDGAAALVYVLGGAVGEEDERALRAADVAGVPIVVIGPDPETPIPYVLATDVLPCARARAFRSTSSRGCSAASWTSARPRSPPSFRRFAVASRRPSSRRSRARTGSSPPRSSSRASTSPCSR